MNEIKCSNFNGSCEYNKDCGINAKCYKCRLIRGNIIPNGTSDSVSFLPNDNGHWIKDGIILYGIIDCLEKLDNLSIIHQKLNT